MALGPSAPPLGARFADHPTGGGSSPRVIWFGRVSLDEKVLGEKITQIFEETRVVIPGT